MTNCTNWDICLVISGFHQKPNGMRVNLYVIVVLSCNVSEGCPSSTTPRTNTVTTLLCIYAVRYRCKSQWSASCCWDWICRTRSEESVFLLCKKEIHIWKKYIFLVPKQKSDSMRNKKQTATTSTVKGWANTQSMLKTENKCETVFLSSQNWLSVARFSKVHGPWGATVFLFSVQMRWRNGSILNL